MEWLKEPVAFAEIDFSTALRGRLALADPDHVPAGLYARQALESIGWWHQLAPTLVPAPHVRAALVYVERAECAAGIVYATDAAISDRVRVAAVIPDSLHEPIRYPIAVVAGRGSPEVDRVLTQLQSPAVAELFRRHGFEPLPAESSAASRTDVVR